MVVEADDVLLPYLLREHYLLACEDGYCILRSGESFSVLFCLCEMNVDCPFWSYVFFYSFLVFTSVVLSRLSCKYSVKRSLLCQLPRLVLLPGG